MRKIILFAAVLFATTSMVKAQAANPDMKRGDVTLKLNLHAFQSIEIGGGGEGDLDGETGLVGGAVVLDYNTVEKYQDGVSRTINDHIKIKSAGGYAINVKSAVASLSDDSGASDVPMNTILLSAKAKDGVTANINNGLSLSSGGAVFISSESGLGQEISFDITYKGASGNNYGQYVDKTGKTRNLETLVTYEIVAG